MQRYTGSKLGKWFLIGMVVITATIVITLFYIRSNHRQIALSSKSQAEERFNIIQNHLKNPLPSPLSQYQILDNHIDDYLTKLISGNTEEGRDVLRTSQQIATEMETQTGERWGRDIVNYYRNISIKDAQPLYTARQMRKDVSKLIDKIDEAINKGWQINSIFDSYGADFEVLQMNVLIIGYISKTDKSSSAIELTEICLQQARSHNYLLIQAELLLKRGELLGNTSDYSASITDYEESIRIAKPLNVAQFITRPTSLLASTYYVTNDNDRAFNLSFEILKTSLENDLKVPIQAIQILGISSYNLHFPDLAEQYLQLAISYAQQQKHYPHLAISYTLYGIVQAEENKFTESEEKFLKAREVLHQLTDQHAHARVEFSVTGYQARAEMLAGNVDRSIEMYEKALNLSKQINYKQKLPLSQLHQGLAECMMAKGNIDRAKEELQVAIALDREARANFEHNNHLLTFAVTRQSSQQQLEQLESIR